MRRIIHRAGSVQGSNIRHSSSGDGDDGGDDGCIDSSNSYLKEPSEVERDYSIYIT